MNLNRFFLSIFPTLLPFASISQSASYTISGTISDLSNGEVLIGATIHLSPTLGTTSNSYGFYSLTLPEGEYLINVSFLGFESSNKPLELFQDIRLDIGLQQDEVGLQAVEVYSTSIGDLYDPIGGIHSISPTELTGIPALMGEHDPLMAIRFLPGVQPTSETSSGFSVRGGNRDQNLVLLDEATVYNASHLMGIFSVFNVDAIKNMSFYKGYIPTSFGGRLSSTLDIQMKDGSNEGFTTSGGVGLISSRLTIESPIANKKGSFMIAGRRTYADLFLPFSKNQELKNSKLYFYDLNAKFSYSINDNNRILLAGYFGRDYFYYAGNDFSPKIDWGNATLSARWNHLFNQKIFSNLSVISSFYTFSGFTSTISSQFNKVTGGWKSDLKDFNLKYDLSYFKGSNFTINWGASVILHRFSPGRATLEYEDQGKFEVGLPKSSGLENSLYVEIQAILSEKMKLQGGLRLASFHNVGPSIVYRMSHKYEPLDTLQHKDGIYNSYFGPEPKIAFSYQLSKTSSIKVVYNHTQQFVQIASNSSTGTPIDAWIPSSPNLKPQLADQFSIGYFRNLNSGHWLLEGSVEAYYKLLSNQIDYKDHANLLFSENIESQLRVGKGTAYGIEFMLKKSYGTLTGWVSYTLSRSYREINGVNANYRYLSPYDRPHNLSIVETWQLNERLSISTNFVYYSGAPFTSPVGRYEYGGEVLPIYTERNGDRLPDYHRFDLSVTWKNKVKSGRKWQSEWDFSVYNLYFRKNPTVIYFSNDFFNQSITQATMIYVLPVLPSVTYNFKFL